MSLSQWSEKADQMLVLLLSKDYILVNVLNIRMQLYIFYLHLLDFPMQAPMFRYEALYLFII